MTTPRLVALDLDGTIVDERLTISPQTLGALQHLITRSDIRVVIATGRMHPSATRFARQVGVTTPIITYQGAMVKEALPDSEPIFHQPIPLPLAQELVDYLLDEHLSVNIYMDDVLWTNPNNAYYMEYAKTAGIEPHLTDDLRGKLTVAPTKILIIDDTRVNTLRDDIRDRFGDQLGSCRSRYNFCEVNHPDVSKWAGLTFLMKDWGIAPAEVIAIGDQGNDISMLSGAGIGVAMGNAPEDVKAVADFITRPIEEDGVVHALRHFGLLDDWLDNRAGVTP
ncbi:MAG: Cof-type HAD-IIB family hydrolase [Candidatus Melainabacteria bacterium]